MNNSPLSFQVFEPGHNARRGRKHDEQNGNGENGRTCQLCSVLRVHLKSPQPCQVGDSWCL